MSESPAAITWPVRLDTKKAAAFISEELGLPCSEKTLSNWRSQGLGPEVEYFGTKPLYRQSELERWARDAVQPEPPARRPGRKGKQVSNSTLSTP